MLKSHAQSSSTLARGRTLLIALGLLSAGVVYALQASPNTTDRVKLVLHVTLDGKDNGSPTVITQSGQTATVSFSDEAAPDQSDRAWTLEITPNKLADKQLLVQTKILYGSPGQLVSNAKIMVKLGETAGIQVGTADGAHTIRMEMLGTTVP